MRHLPRAAISLVLMLAACGGGGGGTGEGGCSGDCVSTDGGALTAADVERVLAQGVFEAQARGARATIAVSDRVGNVLAVYRMAGASDTFRIASGRGIVNGLDGIAEGVLPASHAAIAKAITGAYLSSEGNAFSTRTASQIVQENFNPRESQSPSGPLYGVQFSQLICSDLIAAPLATTQGPKPSPLGLSADPGGLPLYKNGTVVGGVGVLADGLYGLDLDIADIDQDTDEMIAVAAARGFDAPPDRRGDRITADGRTFRYVDSEQLASDPARAGALTGAGGALIAALPYFDGMRVRAGTAFRTAASGFRPDTGPFAAQGGVVLVDATNNNRFAPKASADGSLTARDVTVMLQEALKVAGRARAQIRRPLGASAEVTIALVDRRGDVLGLVRTPDAPVFGTDVSLQKARGALLFSHPEAATQLAALPPARALVPFPPGVSAANVVASYVANQPAFPQTDFGGYVNRFRAFTEDPAALSGGVAYTTRAIGNLHRPTYPDGIAGTGPGPLSTPIEAWSPFAVGLQLDLIANQLIKSLAAGDDSKGCAGRRVAGGSASVSDAGLALARNGIQIFPGSVPIYRGSQLVGAIGISGDGVDQDDMIAFLGLANASAILNNGLGNAPPAMRADTLTPQGVRLRYVQCPQAPFNGSSEQDVCRGL